ncbi:hypothetical protein TNCV_2603841 [Trichonephila clavipes]|nr:hypothetical protein TNCV_2603841 [Trichonephila clavipes]
MGAVQCSGNDITERKFLQPSGHGQGLVVGARALRSSLLQLKTYSVERLMNVKFVEVQIPPIVVVWKLGEMEEPA